MEQMGNITQMEKGHLSCEYRKSKSGQRKGPYYKHQKWEKGRNCSCRVPADQVESLREALVGREQFEKLSKQYMEVTVSMTRCGETQESKKKEKSSLKLVMRRRRNSSP